MKDGDYLNSDYRACCGFGHRQVFENITEQLERRLNMLLIRAVKPSTRERWAILIACFPRLYEKQR